MIYATLVIWVKKIKERRGGGSNLARRQMKRKDARSFHLRGRKLELSFENHQNLLGGKVRYHFRHWLCSIFEERQRAQWAQETGWRVGEVVHKLDCLRSWKPYKKNQSFFEALRSCPRFPRKTKLTNKTTGQKDYLWDQ